MDISYSHQLFTIIVGRIRVPHGHAFVPQFSLWLFIMYQYISIVNRMCEKANVRTVFTHRARACDLREEELLGRRDYILEWKK